MRRKDEKLVVNKRTDKRYQIHTDVLSDARSRSCFECLSYWPMLMCVAADTYDSVDAYFLFNEETTKHSSMINERVKIFAGSHQHRLTTQLLHKPKNIHPNPLTLKPMSLCGLQQHINTNRDLPPCKRHDKRSTIFSTLEQCLNRFP
jgi:hypothetical protein